MSFLKDVFGYYPRSDGERATIAFVALVALVGAVPTCMWVTGLLVNK